MTIRITPAVRHAEHGRVDPGDCQLATGMDDHLELRLLTRVRRA
jgi:hypothetical protein